MKYVGTTSHAIAMQEIGPSRLSGPDGTRCSVPSTRAATFDFLGCQCVGVACTGELRAGSRFGVGFLLRMWDDETKTLYYQVGNSQDWDNFYLLSNYDIWRLPQHDNNSDGCDASARFICHQPVFVAGPAGSRISPNLAGRQSVGFVVYCGRWIPHVSKLHSAAGGEPGGRARWHVGRNSGVVGRSFRGSGIRGYHPSY